MSGLFFVLFITYISFLFYFLFLVSTSLCIFVNFSLYIFVRRFATLSGESIKKYTWLHNFICCYGFFFGCLFKIKTKKSVFFCIWHCVAFCHVDCTLQSNPNRVCAHRMSQWNCLSCSYVMKNMIFHGPMRNHVGMKPLYSANNPSLRTVCIPQSRLPRYRRLLCVSHADVVLINFFWFIKRVCKMQKKTKANNAR